MLFRSVAGVVFPKGFYDERINDSKQLSAKKREVLYDLIIENALYYDIEIISVADVDRLNVCTKQVNRGWKNV